MWCRGCDARAWTTRGCDSCSSTTRGARLHSCSSLRADASRARIVRRLEVRGRREALEGELELPAPGAHERRVDAVRGGDVAHAHGATERVAVRARGDASGQHTVAVDRLVAEQQRRRVVEREEDQTA